jgi:molybdenum cofactor cytidylyltransferase
LDPFLLLANEFHLLFCWNSIVSPNILLLYIDFFEPLPLPVREGLLDRWNSFVKGHSGGRGVLLRRASPRFLASDCRGSLRMRLSSNLGMQRNLAGLVLAAGPSTRLGRPKQLLVHRKQTLIERVAELAADCCGAGVTVVTGSQHAAIVSALAGLTVDIVHNPGWREGMSSSIRAGLAHIEQTSLGVMLMLCDQPSISRADYRALVEVWMSNPDSIVAAEYADTLGAPAIFPLKYRDDLMALTGDQGGRVIIAAAEQVEIIKIPNAEFDIDTPIDLKNLEA